VFQPRDKWVIGPTSGWCYPGLYLTKYDVTLPKLTGGLYASITMGSTEGQFTSETFGSSFIKCWEPLLYYVQSCQQQTAVLTALSHLQLLLYIDCMCSIHCETVQQVSQVHAAPYDPLCHWCRIKICIIQLSVNAIHTNHECNVTIWHKIGSLKLKTVALKFHEINDTDI